MRRDQRPRRHALERGVDRGEHHARLLAALQAREPRQRRHALRHDAGMRRHAVVRQAIPGGKLVDLDFGREERERARKLRHARPVAADHHEAGRRRVRLRRDSAGEIGDDQALGAVRDARERQGAAGNEKFGGRLRHQAAPRKSRMLAEHRRVELRRRFAARPSPTRAGPAPARPSAARTRPRPPRSCCAICASAKRPVIRSTSRMPRCQARNSRRRRRSSRPSLEIGVPLMSATVRNTKSPDVPGRADIATEAANVSGPSAAFGAILLCWIRHERAQSAARLRTAVPHQSVSRNGRAAVLSPRSRTRPRDRPAHRCRNTPMRAASRTAGS